MKKIFAILLFSVCLTTTVYADNQTTESLRLAKAAEVTSIPATNQAQLQQAVKPDTEGVLKARLKAYKVQNKMEKELTERQVKSAIKGLRSQKKLKTAQTKIAVEQAKQ